MQKPIRLSRHLLRLRWQCTRFCQTETGRKSSFTESEAHAMQKLIKQNHLRSEERRQWAQFTNQSSKKSLWQSFSTRCERYYLSQGSPGLVFNYYRLTHCLRDRKALANAAKYFWSALSVEDKSSDFLKSARGLTKQIKLNIQLIHYRDRFQQC